MNAADHYILVGPPPHVATANENHDPNVSLLVQSPRIPFSPGYRFRVWLASNRKSH